MRKEEVEKIIGGRIVEIYTNNAGLWILIEKDGKKYTLEAVADCETEYGGDCDEGNCFCIEDLNVYVEEYRGDGE